MYSRCAPIAGHVTCRNRPSVAFGNHPATRCAHTASPTATPPGARPAATAGAKYLRTVLRSNPKLSLICTCDRPPSQCTNNSTRSTTSNDLLLINALPSRPGRPEVSVNHEQDPQRQRRAAVPMGNYVTNQGGELRDHQPVTPGELHDR